jgi:hypothetical protein
VADRLQDAALRHLRRSHELNKVATKIRAGECRGPAMRLTRRRKEQIVMAYVLTTRGRLPTHLGELLRGMRERMGPVSEDEVRRAIRWMLRRPAARAKGGVG